MSRSVVRHPQAEADAQESAIHLALGNLEAGYRFYDALEATLEALLEHPELGRLREFDNPAVSGIRSWPVKGFDQHLIFYRPTEDGLELIRVLHGARDIDRLFGP